MPPSLTATYCATLVDEWIRAGLRHAVVSPGSRSTPLALALAARPELTVHIVHDERAAAFVGLGIGAAEGVPALVVCTSGTAAAELHAGVVEAHQADVPLLVCTADRPPELHGVGAAQTIEQAQLFTGAVRWALDPGAPDGLPANTWRAVAARAFASTISGRPGPAHLNAALREPLVGEPGPLPPGRDAGPWSSTVAGRRTLGDDQLTALARRLSGRRGVIVAGGGTGVPAAAGAIHDLAERLGWPVLADPRSGCRLERRTTMVTFDSLLRAAAFAGERTAEVVLRFGHPPASKLLAEWVGPCEQIQVVPEDVWIDPANALALRVMADPEPLCRSLVSRLGPPVEGSWLDAWADAERRAQGAFDAVLADRPPSEPGLARALVGALAPGSHLVVSSSMPIRDVEWFTRPHDGITVHANRGANGIDGVTATAIGVALACRAPTALLTGDIAAAHDASALTALARRDVDLVMVVVDNDGGGIFSFLPQAALLPADRFEELFGTPHGTSIELLAAAHGLPVTRLESLDELPGVLRGSGPRVAVVHTDRATNAALHRELHEAVAAALR